MVGGPASPVQADRIWVERSRFETTVREGTIVDVTAEFVVLERLAGRPERVRRDRVVRMDYDRTAAHQQAETAFLAHDDERALVLWDKALGEEKRPWVRRQIQARRCQTLQNLDRFLEAARAYAAWVPSDPTLLHLDAAPLLWRHRQASGAMQAWAVRHLESDEPAIRLVAASWLLASVRRGQAIEVLSQLQKEAPKRLALLARFQQDRATSIGWKKTDIDRAASRLVQLPRELRAGPAWIIGQAYARQKDGPRAVRWFLRIPLLYPNQRTLAAAALERAAELEAAAGHAAHAQRLRDRLRQWYGDAAPAARLRAGQHAGQPAEPPRRTDAKPAGDVQAYRFLSSRTVAANGDPTTGPRSFGRAPQPGAEAWMLRKGGWARSVGSGAWRMAGGRDPWRKWMGSHDVDGLPM